jgi:hypothetical protein
MWHRDLGQSKQTKDHTRIEIICSTEGGESGRQRDRQRARDRDGERRPTERKKAHACGKAEPDRTMEKSLRVSCRLFFTDNDRWKKKGQKGRASDMRSTSKRVKEGERERGREREIESSFARNFSAALPVVFPSLIFSHMKNRPTDKRRTSKHISLSIGE